MKKLLITSLMACSVSAYALFPKASVINFSGEYNEPSGSATANEWVSETLNYARPIDITIERQAGVLFLEIEDYQFEFDQLPKQVDDLDYIKWSGVSLKSDGTIFEVGLDSLEGSGVLDNKAVEVGLNKLNIICNNKWSPESQTIVEELLDSCINNSGYVYLNNTSMSKSINGQKITNIKVNIKNNKLSAQAKMKGVGTKISGNIYYEKNLIRVKISKAKVGLISIKSRVFKELEQIENPKLIVNNPWIEIQLD